MARQIEQHIETLENTSYYDATSLKDGGVVRHA